MFVTLCTTIFSRLAAASTASKDTQVSAATFSPLHESVWDAVVEGVLALLVFAVASAMMRTRSKNLRPHKAKVVSSQSHPKYSKEISNECAERKPHSKVSGAPAARPPANGPRKSAASAGDAIASAVRGGKAANLPQILDAAIGRGLADAKLQGVPTSEEDVAASLLHSALRACAASRCFREAIAAYDHVADRIGDGSVGLWSVLLYIIVEAGALKRCHLIFSKLCKQGKPAGNDVVNMVRCCAAREDSEGFREMLAHLRNTGESIDTYTWNRALAALNNSESALELAEELRSADICEEGLDSVSYNTLMKYSARAGQLSKCFGLHSEMIEKGLEASEITFGILLDVCVSAKNLDMAKKVFDDLCASGLPLNVVHCTTYIKGLVSTGKVDEAASTLCEMAKLPGVKPDVVTYSTIVKGYSDVGEFKSALKIVEQMIEEKVRPDEIVYNTVLSGCCTFPLPSDVVISTFKTLVKLGMKPNTTTLSILLKGLAHSEDWAASLKVLNESPQNFHLQPEARLYSQLAQTCAKARAFDQVFHVFDAMLMICNRRQEKVDPVIVGRFLRSCLLAGSMETAWQLQKFAHQAGVAVDPSAEKMLKTSLARKHTALNVAK